MYPSFLLSLYFSLCFCFAKRKKNTDLALSLSTRHVDLAALFSQLGLNYSPSTGGAACVTCDALRYLERVCDRSNRMPGAWSMDTLKLIYCNSLHTHDAKDDAGTLAVVMDAVWTRHLKQAFGAKAAGLFA